jgi:hypothetical protein
VLICHTSKGNMKYFHHSLIAIRFGFHASVTLQKIGRGCENCVGGWEDGMFTTKSFSIRQGSRVVESTRTETGGACFRAATLIVLS